MVERGTEGKGEAETGRGGGGTGEEREGGEGGRGGEGSRGSGECCGAFGGADRRVLERKTKASEIDK